MHYAYAYSPMPLLLSEEATIKLSCTNTLSTSSSESLSIPSRIAAIRRFIKCTLWMVTSVPPSVKI